MALEIFKAGTVVNRLEGETGKARLIHGKVRVTVPARLNAMCFDLRTLARPKSRFVYNAGELAFSVDLGTRASIEITEGGGPGVTVSGKTRRKSIVRHAGLIMEKALGLRDRLHIEADNQHDYPHAGLGSSSSLITAVCIAVNEAYGRPLTGRQLALFIARNHGEEIESNDEDLVHVQCNGGSPSVALYRGGMQVIVGDSDMIIREEIPAEYTFVFGIPDFYEKHDARFMMELEIGHFPGMLKSSADFSKDIAWKVLNELIPSMLRGDMRSIGDVIEYYRFETGSLAIDSMIWKGLHPLLESLLDMRDENNPIVSVSSCGPAVYVLTRNPCKVMERLEHEGMDVFSAKPDNRGCRLAGSRIFRPCL